MNFIRFILGLIPSLLEGLVQVSIELIDVFRGNRFKFIFSHLITVSLAITFSTNILGNKIFGDDAGRDLYKAGGDMPIDRSINTDESINIEKLNEIVNKTYEIYETTNNLFQNIENSEYSIEVTQQSLEEVKALSIGIVENAFDLNQNYDCSFSNTLPGSSPQALPKNPIFNFSWNKFPFVGRDNTKEEKLYQQENPNEDTSPPGRSNWFDDGDPCTGEPPFIGCDLQKKSNSGNFLEGSSEIASL